MKAALDEALAAERALGAALRAVAAAHGDEHDIVHMTRTLGAWCAEHDERLVTLGAAAADGAFTCGDGPLALLWDLRDLHLAAARASVAWTVLGQGAQARRNGALLAAVDASHPETIRTMKWALQRLKEASPQLLSSG